MQDAVLEELLDNVREELVSTNVVGVAVEVELDLIDVRNDADVLRTNDVVDIGEDPSADEVENDEGSVLAVIDVELEDEIIADKRDDEDEDIHTGSADVAL